MEFNEIVQKRYATKLFDGRKLPENKVDELLELDFNLLSKTAIYNNLLTVFEHHRKS